MTQNHILGWENLIDQHLSVSAINIHIYELIFLTNVDNSGITAPKWVIKLTCNFIEFVVVETQPIDMLYLGYALCSPVESSVSDSCRKGSTDVKR